MQPNDRRVVARIAERFELVIPRGTEHEAHFSLEGAKVTGGVHADKVMISGELEGNIESASRVELLATGTVIGDVKASAMTVAAGARMRGHADFGWDDSKGGKTHKNGGSEGGSQP